MFFAPVIKCVGGLHEYGDKWKLEDMKKDVIKLPVKDDGTPDFMFMEHTFKRSKKPQQNASQFFVIFKIKRWYADWSSTKEIADYAIIKD